MGAQGGATADSRRKAARHDARVRDRTKAAGGEHDDGVELDTLVAELGEAVDAEDAAGDHAGDFAAGEVMSGNILGQGYAGGVGMAIGNVFGRVAGEGAARHVSN